MKILIDLIIVIALLWTASVHATFNNGAGGGTSTVTGSVSVTNFPATQPVSAVALPLPSGAATSAKQDSLLTELQLKADLTETQPVSLASQPLPTGASTETTLAALNTKFPAQGNAAGSASVPVVIANDLILTGVTGLSALNTNLLTGNVSDWYDVSSYHSVSIQLLGSAGIASGGVVFEQTNDSANSGAAWPVYEAQAATNLWVTTTTITASSVRIYSAPITARYVRVRVSLAFSGGTVGAVARFSQLPFSQTTVNAVQSVSSNLMMTLGTIASNISMPVANGISQVDVASAAITTTTTSSAAQSPNAGASFEWNIPVTAVAGTNPTMDVVIQESDDTGTNWFDIYHFPRITATGIYRTPPLRQSGNRFRYVQTIGGTGSPSFTRAINRIQLSGSTDMRKQFFDRSITLTSLNSTTPTFYIEGCTNYQLVFSVGAITTTAPQLQLQGSEDSTNWYAIGTPLTAVASSVVQVTTANMNSKFVRALVSTAGVGVTADHILIKGF